MASDKQDIFQLAEPRGSIRRPAGSGNGAIGAMAPGRNPRPGGDSEQLEPHTTFTIRGRLTYRPRQKQKRGRPSADLAALMEGLPAALRRELIDDERAGRRWCCAGLKPLDGADFVDVFAFGAVADELCSFKADDMVEVDVAAGRTRHRAWVGRDGNERTTAQHVAVRVRPVQTVDGCGGADGPAQVASESVA